MILDDFPRLALPDLTGDLTADVGALLKANGKARTYRHVLDVAQRLCNKIAIIKHGRIIASGLMDELIGDQTLEDVFMEVTEHAE